MGTTSNAQAIISNVLNVIKRIHSCIKSSALTREKNGIMLHTKMQVLFGLKLKTDAERLIHETIMSNAVMAEKFCVGGFDRFIELLINEQTSSTNVVSRSAIAPTMNDVKRIVSTCTKDADAFIENLTNKAILSAGFCGKVIVEKTQSNVPSVELVRGYTFLLKQLIPLNVTFTHSRIFCIDGYVENVSEIHHLLESAGEAKEPCVVFLRGASDDVIHTLRTNYDRGSLRVIPIAVNFDLEGMNTLVDISIVCGCDLVSSLKGDLISSIRFSDAPIIDQITVQNGRVVVTNSKTHNRVSQHVYELRNRRNDESIDDKGMLFDKRIRSLTPNHVIVRLPNNRNFIVNSQAIDQSLRSVKSMIEHGLTIDGELVAKEIAAQTYVVQCMRTLNDLDGIIFA
jgi:hypothetical protein